MSQERDVISKRDIVVRAWGWMKKNIVPTAFAALFYIAAFLLGSRTLCVFKATYGIPCPGCGMTRSFLCLLHGDVEGAFYWHPLFILPILAGLVFIFRNKGFISKIYRSKVFWISMLVLFIAVWVVRMVLMFPHQPPLDFNSDGLLPVFWRLICGIGHITAVL